MDPGEPHWRTNSSFSPPPARRWDCRYPSDGLSHRVHDATPYGSSLSLLSTESRGAFGSDQYLNHHHSISDGALSYVGSPSDNPPPPRWTPSAHRYDLGEFSTPAGGARPETPSYPRSNSMQMQRRFPPVNSFGSASPFSESTQPASSSGKQPVFFPSRGYMGRRSFMSKPIYPLVFRNPVSESGPSAVPETSNGGRTTPSDDSRASPAWAGTSMTSPELKFHKALTELQKMEASPGSDMSSRREGFRWSNASSYDFGFDGDAIDLSEHVSMESQRCPTNSMRFQKCGLCERLLWQKSPWSSNRIVRSGDMPVAGVLPCQHVFHADCLEETTPKSEIQEPPCPVCLRAANGERSVSFSEPLQVVLQSPCQNRGPNVASSSTNPMVSEDDLKRNQSVPAGRCGGSLIRSRFKRQFPFKGKIGKDLFTAKVFRKSGSLSYHDPRLS